MAQVGIADRVTAPMPTPRAGLVDMVNRARPANATPEPGAARETDTEAGGGWSIVVPDWCALMRFLDVYPQLRRIVHAAYQQIPTHFPQARVTVSVAGDQAARDGSYLAFTITVPDSGEEETRRCLDRLYREWLEDALGWAHGKLRVRVFSDGEAPGDVTATAALQAGAQGCTCKAS